jgi:DNA-directed RNA polymerase specialized sigma24 family protein
VSDWEHVLDTLVRERGPALVRYAAPLTGDLGDADELVQEALIRSFSQGRPLREALAAERYVRRAILSIFLDG